MLKLIINFFDKLEDRVRNWLSRKPILYAFIGGTGVVLFWRGVWHTADYFTERYLVGIPETSKNSIDLLFPFWWDGMFSLIIGSILLLSTGLLVSSFIGKEIIISGVKGEKKLVEKAEKEIIKEISATQKVEKEIKAVAKKLDRIEKKISRKK